MKYEIRQGKILKLIATTQQEKAMLRDLDRDLDEAAYSPNYYLRKLAAQNESGGINALEFTIRSDFLDRKEKQEKQR